MQNVYKLVNAHADDDTLFITVNKNIKKWNVSLKGYTDLQGTNHCQRKDIVLVCEDTTKSMQQGNKLFIRELSSIK